MRLARVLARFTPARRGADLPWVRTAYRLPVAKKWAVSSAVEHCFHTAGATGSIPVPPTSRVEDWRGKPLSGPRFQSSLVEPDRRISRIRLSDKTSRGRPRTGLGKGPQVHELGVADVREMLALAGVTQPGPFGPRTVGLGDYTGIRQRGVLVAMAGERMRIAGFTEISTVCVEAAYRGQSLQSARS
jgi:hypothetical protein